MGQNAGTDLGKAGGQSRDKRVDGVQASGGQFVKITENARPKTTSPARVSPRGR
ncbi:hypothetical protein GGD66_002074 [Bradyrhizobium sp. CIR48]|nr:hypothetical protein [Bradyrhizobium sp. CIR48]